MKIIQGLIVNESLHRHIGTYVIDFPQQEIKFLFDKCADKKETL